MLQCFSKQRESISLHVNQEHMRVHTLSRHTWGYVHCLDVRIAEFTDAIVLRRKLIVSPCTIAPIPFVSGLLSRFPTVKFVLTREGIRTNRHICTHF